jgi:hypothetical protein
MTGPRAAGPLVCVGRFPKDTQAPMTTTPRIQAMSLRTLLIIILILLLIGALPAWPYSTSWGYYPSGGLGLVLLILIVVALVR